MARRTREIPPKTSYHHGDLQRTLIQAALAMIEEQDVASLSLREVARRAGVSYAAPYHHFRDKSALLAAVGEEGFRMLEVQLRRKVAQVPETDPMGRIRALMQAYFAFATTHAAHFRVMYLPELADREVYSSFHEVAGRCLDLILEAMARAHPEKGEEELITRALAAWSTSHGLASLWNERVLHSHPGLSPPQRLAEGVLAHVASWAAHAPTPAKRGRRSS